MSAGEVCSFPCRWWISSARVGVCGTASVLIWEGPVLCVCVTVCIGMPGVYLSMCPSILNSWGEFEFALGVFEKLFLCISVRSMSLSEREGFLRDAHVSGAKPKTPKTHISSLILWESPRRRFYPCDSSTGRFYGTGWHFYMNNGLLGDNPIRSYSSHPGSQQ